MPLFTCHRAFGLAASALVFFLNSSLSSLAKAEELELDQLLQTGQQLIRDNEEQIHSALGQLEERADELRNRVVDAQVPTAIYDRLETQPVGAEQLAKIQELAGDAKSKGFSWAKHPVLAAMRYYNALTSSESKEHASFHLRMEYESAEAPSTALVSIIEDQLLDDSTRGTRYDIELKRDLEANTWMPTGAAWAALAWSDAEPSSDELLP